MRVLVLMDIDQTMLASGGAGLRAMVGAGRELYGPSFHADGLDFSGRIDPLLVAEMLTLNGVTPTRDEHARFRAVYAQTLATLVAGGMRARTLPGVPALLDALEGVEGLALGLLTGNYEETGTLKLESAGISVERFVVRVWGDDSPHDPPARDHLPRVGIERYCARFGRAIEGERVVVVGDTVHDVACARAHGCRAVGVATGRTTAEALRASGADLVVDDLTDTAGLVRWIVGSAQVVG